MNDNIKHLSEELDKLTEIKSPGTFARPVTEEQKADFDEEALSKITIPGPDGAGPEPPGAESGPHAGDYAEKVSFDASSYVEQGVIVVDALLQSLFDQLDKRVTLAKEDRNGLNFLLWKEKNGLNKTGLSDYERWLLAEGAKLAETSESRVMTDSERANIVNALKQMPWLKDRLMTPANQLTLALLLYFGVRLVPIGFKYTQGPDRPPADAVEVDPIVKDAPPTPFTGTKNQKPTTHNPEPKTRNSEPITHNPEPITIKIPLPDA